MSEEATIVTRVVDHIINIKPEHNYITYVKNVRTYLMSVTVLGV